MGAGAHFAEHLRAELLRGLLDKYAAANQTGDLQVTEVRMPKFMRSPGALGTHWMMQPRIDLEIDGKTVMFHDHEVVLALSAAYANGQHRVPSTLVDAIKRSPEFSDTWPALLKAIL